MSTKLETLESNRAGIAASVANAETIFNAIDGTIKTDAEKAKNKGWNLAKSSLDEARAVLEKLDKQIADEKATAQAAAVIQPFVNAFGTVNLTKGANAPANFHVVDLEKLTNEARDLVARGNDRLKLYEAASAALKAANLPEGQTIERPIHFVVEGNNVKIAVASRGGGARSGGTRASGAVVRITGSKSGDYVGDTVGSKDSTYPSWRAFLESVDAPYFAELETKKKEKNNNYSAKDKAVKRFDLTFEVVAPTPAENGAAPAKEPVTA